MGIAASGAEPIETTLELGPDLVPAGTGLPMGSTGLDTEAAICQPRERA
jgi:hypothetical protein